MRRLLITAAAAMALLAGCGGDQLGAEGGGTAAPVHAGPGNHRRHQHL